MFLSRNRERIEAGCGRGLVLDVGGWADPFPRADYVLDLFSYETRGIAYHGIGRMPDSARHEEPLPGERFSRKTWVVHDICSSRPFPFPDKMFDFVICSHTLEDVRDPLRVCEELMRVAKAGYLETPSRIVEQTIGFSGTVGASHHRWMVEMDGRGVRFTMKPPHLHATLEACVPLPHTHRLTDQDRYAWLFWEDRFNCKERLTTDPLRDAIEFARSVEVPRHAWWRWRYGCLKHQVRGLARSMSSKGDGASVDPGFWTWSKLVAAAAPADASIWVKMDESGAPDSTRRG